MMETVRLGRWVRVRGLGFDWLVVLLLMITLHLLDDFWIEAVTDHLGCVAQSVLDRQRRRSAMGNDRDAIDAQEWHSAIFVGVGDLVHGAESWFAQGGAEFAD